MVTFLFPVIFNIICMSTSGNWDSGWKEKRKTMFLVYCLIKSSPKLFFSTWMSHEEKLKVMGEGKFQLD